MKLDVRALGLAFGILWGSCLFVLTWWLIAFEGSGVSAGMFGRMYLGYSITPVGSLVGLAWGFVDGLICGLVLAWLYNRLAK